MSEQGDKDRIAALEAVIRDVPGYMDNWKWAERNFDLLKTIEGYRFPNIELAKRAGEF